MSRILPNKIYVVMADNQPPRYFWEYKNAALLLSEDGWVPLSLMDEGECVMATFHHPERASYRNGVTSPAYASIGWVLVQDGILARRAN